MARIILFDSFPTGLACHGKGNSEAADFRAWMYGEWVNGSLLIIPAIVDYEVRRSLIRNEAWDGIVRLDALYASKRIRSLSISDAALKTAARLWADARRRGEQTAHDHALDADVILSAQAIEFCSEADDWQIITENVRLLAEHHLRFEDEAISFPRSSVGMTSSTLCVGFFGSGQIERRGRGASRTAFPRRTVGTRFNRRW